MARKRLGEILIEEGLIDDDDLAEALRYKEKSGYRLGTALVALRIIAEWQLTEALGKALQLQVVDPNAKRPTKAALKKIPARLAERFDLIPISLSGRGKNRELLIAMSDPLNRSVIKRMQDVAGCAIRPALAGLSAIQRAIRIHYHGTAASEIYKKADRLRTGETATGRRPSGSRRRRSAPASEDAIARLMEEARHLGQEISRAARPKPLELDPGEFLLSLEVKLRAVLHLLLKKQIISEREYAEALKHFLQPEDGREGS